MASLMHEIPTLNLDVYRQLRTRTSISQYGRKIILETINIRHTTVLEQGSMFHPSLHA